LCVSKIIIDFSFSIIKESNASHAEEKDIKNKDPGGGIHVDLFSDDHVLMTVDHVVPRSKGGTTVLSNLVPMCKKCNERKLSKDLETFLAERNRQT